LYPRIFDGLIPEKGQVSKQTNQIRSFENGIKAYNLVKAESPQKASGGSEKLVFDMSRELEKI
jgi:hypothetical protein